MVSKKLKAAAENRPEMQLKTASGFIEFRIIIVCQKGCHIGRGKKMLPQDPLVTCTRSINSEFTRVFFSGRSIST